MFAYSYVAPNASTLFYLAMMLSILGTGGVLLGIRRIAKV
jgi:hypothetical protein